VKIIIKVLLLLSFINQVSLAKEFDIFLKEVLANSSYLNSSMLRVKQAQEEGAVLNRYKNPSLELEFSQFSLDSGSSKSGNRVAITQAVRLWGVADAKEQLSDAINESAKSTYTQKRATFIKNISLMYLYYAEGKKFLKLAEETQVIAKKIYEISNARYESGTVSRGIMLQAKIDFDMVEVQQERVALGADNSYYRLLKYAGVDGEVVLDADYTFEVEENKETQNPDIQIIHANKKQALSQVEVSANKVEWLDLYAEYENEPDQDIARIGLNIPLALFNTKTQERQIALLEAEKSDLRASNELKKLSVEIRRLLNERKLLKAMLSKYKKLIVSEMQLLEMFQKAYKISSINLLALQDVKNRLIKTKEALINIKTALNKNAILTNYIQGNYNE